ncbi:MAG: ATP-binding protein [Cyclobacteriaceae bacterium]
MMSLQEIQRLVGQGEGENIEFKRKVAHPDKIVREIVAFANTTGGHLLIGVDDDGSIPGIKFAEEEIFVLERAIQRWCRPQIDYHYQVIPLNQKRAVVHYFIKESPQKPYLVLSSALSFSENGAADHPPFTPSPQKPQHRRKGTAYVRHQDKSLQASTEVWQILKQSRNARDIRFTYGDKEQLLMQHLEQHQKITLREFSLLAKLPRRVASRTLVRLVLANVLKVIPKEKEDVFILNFS